MQDVRERRAKPFTTGDAAHLAVGQARVHRPLGHPRPGEGCDYEHLVVLAALQFAPAFLDGLAAAHFVLSGMRLFRKMYLVCVLGI